MRVSQATGAAIGQAIKGTAQQATKLYAEIETRKSENEVLEKTKELYEGNDNFEGLSMVVEKASMMDDPDEAIKYYNNGFEAAKNSVGLNFNHRFSKKIFDQFLSKQQLKDGLAVRQKTNANFIAKSQTLDLEKLEKLKKITKKNLGPTYGFARQYTKYSTMPEHIDRPSCEYSATLFVGSCERHKWPIKMKGKDYILEPGSALLYKGCDWKHSRDEFLGDWHLQIFLHWVDMNGPNAEFLFDKRKCLGEGNRGERKNV